MSIVISHMRMFRSAAVLFFLMSSLSVRADIGAVEYWGGAKSLVEMMTFIQAFLNITVEMLNVIATLVAFYSVVVIYFKLQNHEGDFSKSVIMLLGAIVYFLVMLVVFPSLFGGVYGTSGHGGFFGWLF